MPKRLFSQGFTLVELMITIAVVAIILTLAVPSMQSVVRAVRVDSEIQNIVNLLQYARGEAVKRGVDVSVSTPSNWTGVATVFVDTNANLVQDSGEATLLQSTLGGTISATNVSGHLTKGVRFNGIGELGQNPNSSAPRTLGSIGLIDDQGKHRAVVCVNSTGRNHVIKPSTPSPSPIAC